MKNKKYDMLDIKLVLRRLVISTKGKSSIVFSSKNGIGFAEGYIGVQTSTFGVFIEFSYTQIYRPVLYFPGEENDNFFVWMLDGTTKRILQPRWVVEGTAFSPHNYYVRPENVFTGGLRILKNEDIK